MLKSRNSLSTDPTKLAPKIRPEDIAEIAASSGSTPLQALEMGLTFSDDPKTITLDDEPVAMFGVCRSATPGIGWCWMLCSDEIEKHQVQFLRRGRELIREVNADYDLIGNFVDARNTVHIRWLRWLGFTFIKLHQDWGVERRPFYEFIRIN
jgi:hypothetical protein